MTIGSLWEGLVMVTPSTAAASLTNSSSRVNCPKRIRAGDSISQTPIVPCPWSTIAPWATPSLTVTVRPGRTVSSLALNSLDL